MNCVGLRKNPTPERIPNPGAMRKPVRVISAPSLSGCVLIDDCIHSPTIPGRLLLPIHHYARRYAQGLIDQTDASPSRFTFGLSFYLALCHLSSH